MENLFLRIVFDYGVHKHRHFNNLSVNIVEDLKLLEEDNWDMIIDKRVSETQELI